MCKPNSQEDICRKIYSQIFDGNPLYVEELVGQLYESLWDGTPPDAMWGHPILMESAHQAAADLVHQELDQWIKS